MLEELEHEMPITEDQAKCYLESIHDHHREMANEFLQRYKEQTNNYTNIRILPQLPKSSAFLHGLLKRAKY